MQLNIQNIAIEQLNKHMVILADLESALQKRQIGTANKNTRRGDTISMQLKNLKAFDKKYWHIHKRKISINTQ